MNKTHLSEIVRLFVVKEKQQRLLGFLDSPKRYEDFLHDLLRDDRNLRDEFIIEVPNSEADHSHIESKLREMGAGPDAYLVSDDCDVDGKSGPLGEMLSSVTGEGEIVYCIGTKLGYYEGHHNWRYLLDATRLR